MSKTIVITGGSSGIGKELVKEFLQNGDVIINLSRTNNDNYDNFIECDVTDIESVKSAFNEIATKYHQIDLLINNAGIGISGATELLDVEKIETCIQTNYFGAINVTRQALAIMPRKSKIVNISSVSGLIPVPYRGVYASAKSAMNMFSYSLRMELANYGIKVVCICPGDVKTEFTANRLKDFETNEKYGDSIALSTNHIDSRQDKRMSVGYVAKKIFKICEEKNGAKYIIGIKYKVFNFFQKLLPTTLFNFLVAKMFIKSSGNVSDKQTTIIEEKNKNEDEIK